MRIRHICGDFLIYLEEDAMTEVNKQTTTAVRKPKFTMQNATPFIELDCPTKDAAGNVANIIVGFKRHDSDTSQKLLEAWAELEKPVIDLMERKKAKEEVSDVLFEDTTKSVKVAIDSFLREQVLYMRKVQLMSVDGVKPGPLVQDTRTHDDASLWEGWDSCLDFLLDISFDYSIWREALMAGAMKALQNRFVAKEAEGKN